MARGNAEIFKLACGELLELLDGGGATTAVVADAAASLHDLNDAARGESLGPGQSEQMREIADEGRRFARAFAKLAADGDTTDTTWTEARRNLLKLLPAFLEEFPPTTSRVPTVATGGMGGTRFVIRAVSDFDSVVIDTSAVPERGIGSIEFSRTDRTCEAFGRDGTAYGLFDTANDAKSEIVERYDGR